MMTYADIAKLTGVPEATLRSWVHRGKLPPPDLKPTRSVALWKPETIEQWRTNERPDQT